MCGMAHCMAKMILQTVRIFVEEIRAPAIDTYTNCMSYEHIILFPYSQPNQRREGHGSGQTGENANRLQIARMLREVEHSRYPLRDRVMVLLSVRAGLRAKEIALATWGMVLDAEGNVSDTLELHDKASKGTKGGREIPLHPELRAALEHAPPAGGIVEIGRSDIGDRQTPTIAARSDLTIEAQIAAPGATWLDRQLVSRERAEVSHIGFGRDVREALQRRTDHLTTEELARRDGQRIMFAPEAHRYPSPAQP
jgi:Protein of unknown function (DUF3363)